MSDPVAGWYPDPYDDRRLRYWDGSAWTESVTDQPPATPAAPGPAGPWAEPSGPAAAGPTAAGPPLYQPAAAPPAFTPAGGPNPASHGYGDLGDWLNPSLGILPRHLGPLAVLLFALPALGLLPAAIVAGSVIERLSVEASRNEVDVSGFDLNLAVGAVVLSIVAALLSAVGWLGANHHLHAAHAGRDPKLGSSLAVGLRRLPRAIGWGLVALVAGLLLLIAVGVAFAVLIVLADASPALSILIGLLAMLVAGVAVVWLWVRLNFVGVAVAVAPSGTNPFGASWGFTARRWWATFGRLLLLAILVAGVGFVLNIITQAVALPQFGGNLSVAPNGEDLLVDGVPIQDLDSIDLSDFVPGPGGFLLLALISLISQAIQQCVSISGITALYLRGGGPAD
ncbi:MAG: DUF2510 domain-containing protein [Actinomycetota bacterium]